MLCRRGKARTCTGLVSRSFRGSGYDPKTASRDPVLPCLACPTGLDQSRLPDEAITDCQDEIVARRTGEELEHIFVTIDRQSLDQTRY